MIYVKENAKNIYREQMQLFAEYKALNLTLDMSRGKPSKEQLDLSNGFFDVFNSKSNFISKIDYRNYGLLEGIVEAREVFADLCGVETDEILVMGNSSLNIMYDMLQRSMQFGVNGGVPFNKQSKIKWLCPVPGYDRHFAITELFGIEMINIPMDEHGPDMDLIEKYVQDESVKGIWCVPKYSNPSGIVYSDEVVERFAKLKPKAKDFRIYWDNAYMIHYLKEDVELKNLLQEAKKYGNEDLVYMFGSTSKITFAGAGVAFVCTSKNNVQSVKKFLSIQTIGYDKINQYAHVLFLKNKENIKEHMKKHSEIIEPKFEIVYKILKEQVGDICDISQPRGGYFISCDLPYGTAKRAVALAKELGVIITGAGATFPYRIDPCDSNVRIAPTLPTQDELITAMNIFCCCIKLAWAEKNMNA